MPSRHNPVDLEQVLRTTAPPPPFPPASERAAWRKVNDSLGEAALDEWRARTSSEAKDSRRALP